MAKQQSKREPELGFTLHLDTAPGLTLVRLREIVRGLEDYAERHELEISGTQLRFVVRGCERSLGVDDQVELLNWLIDIHGLCRARIGSLVPDPDEQEPEETGYLDVSAGDFAVIGATMLYRLGRIAAEQYLQILGGFVRPAMH